MDVTLPFDRRGPRRARSLPGLVSNGVLDAELAALVSLLVEARVPVVVAGTVSADARAEVLLAVLEALPRDTVRVALAGPVEDFGWLPEAESLGWRRDGPLPAVAEETAPAERTVIVAGEQAPADAGSAWAGVVRIAVRAVSMGYGLGATLAGPTLEHVLATLRGAPTRLTEDELSRLGLVLILEPAGAGGTRVAAAHYLRPVARDMHGHVQKLGPAVLATFDRDRGTFEHFGWGVTPELALRTGRRAGDFELEQERRREAYAAGRHPRDVDGATMPPASDPHRADHAGHDHHDHDHAAPEHDHARTPQ